MPLRLSSHAKEAPFFTHLNSLLSEQSWCRCKAWVRAHPQVYCSTSRTGRAARNAADAQEGRSKITALAPVRAASRSVAKILACRWRDPSFFFILFSPHASGVLLHVSSLPLRQPALWAPRHLSLSLHHRWDLCHSLHHRWYQVSASKNQSKTQVAGRKNPKIHFFLLVCYKRLTSICSRQLWTFSHQTRKFPQLWRDPFSGLA